MARGIRIGTLERVMSARAMKPLALGPYLGELAIRANVTASTIARIIGSHEQTVFRWFFGEGHVQPVWAVKVSQLVALLSWMHATNRVPLDGTLAERDAQLQLHANEFNSLSRSGAKIDQAA